MRLLGAATVFRGLSASFLHTGFCDDNSPPSLDDPAFRISGFRHTQ